MQRYVWFGLGSALLFVLFLTPLPAQMAPGDNDTGPVGTTDDETDAPGEEVTPGWEDLEDPQWGLAGLAIERERMKRVISASPCPVM